MTRHGGAEKETLCGAGGPGGGWIGTRKGGGPYPPAPRPPSHLGSMARGPQREHRTAGDRLVDGTGSTPHQRHQGPNAWKRNV